MIRKAARTDEARAVELMHDAHSHAEFDRAQGFTGFHCPWLPSYAQHVFRQHFMSRDAVVLALDIGGTVQGLLLAAAFDHPFGPVRASKETLWWIDPQHRGRNAVRMLHAYEEWARSRGVRFIGMAGMGSDPRVGKLLMRRGYRVADTNYLKAI